MVVFYYKDGWNAIAPALGACLVPLPCKLAALSLVLRAVAAETVTAAGSTREDPPRGTKTMSRFHTQKWSRVKAFAQCLGACRVPCVGQGSLRNGLAG